MSSVTSDTSNGLSTRANKRLRMTFGSVVVIVLILAFIAVASGNKIAKHRSNAPPPASSSPIHYLFGEG